MPTRVLAFLAVAALLSTTTSAASEELHRYLVSVGANSGGGDRVSLRYAVSDAERFADTMVQMGGVDAANRIVLRDPGRAGLDTALADIAGRIAREAPGARTEILFYYSGHADAAGLRMGEDRLPYADLRGTIERIPATVRITVLDACASGAITRLKGGERRLPFLVDVSSDMKGYAFLTSSTGDEAAQESDAIGASFFTHYLVSGLRGAADVTGDGLVSLTEAYQFAFHETLARTTETVGGAQHPAYDIHLSGTGDVVMTDVRQTSAGLAFGKDLEGRFYVRDGDGHLVAELSKPRDRPVVLGLPAGEYRIHLQRGTELFYARVELGLENLLTVRPEHFRIAEREGAVARGSAGAWPPRPGFLGPLVGRSRLTLSVGWFGNDLSDGTDSAGFVSTSVNAAQLAVGLAYARWLREDFAVGLSVIGLAGDVASDVDIAVRERTSELKAIRIGVRKYGPDSALRTSARPFVSLAVGALLGNETRTDIVGGRVDTNSTAMGAFAVSPGAGIDFILARRLMVGAELSCQIATDFPETLAGKRNYSGVELGVGISWLFGRGFEG